MQIASTFQDLTEYSHLVAPYQFENVMNVGWLDLTTEFAKGEMPSGFFEKLMGLAVGSAIFQPIVEPGRTRPVCGICGEIKLLDSGGKVFRDSELWIPSGDEIYASPIAILHYIQVHRYCPPMEYIEAVLALDVNMPFDGETIYREKLVSSGWFHRPR